MVTVILLQFFLCYYFCNPTSYTSLFMLKYKSMPAMQYQRFFRAEIYCHSELVSESKIDFMTLKERSWSANRRTGWNKRFCKSSI